MYTTEKFYEEVNNLRIMNGGYALPISRILDSIARKSAEKLASGEWYEGHLGWEQRYDEITKYMRVHRLAQSICKIRYGDSPINELMQNPKNLRTLLSPYHIMGAGVAFGMNNFYYIVFLAMQKGEEPVQLPLPS